MDTIIGHTTVLFIISIIVALAAHRLKLPYTVGLVLTGIFLAFAHVTTGVVLTRDLIFDIILPPLLFEAALNIHWHELRRDLLPILILAIVGVLISGAVVACGTAVLLDWPFQAALVFGVLIAATDPVAVIALFKDNGIQGRLKLLVESESLLNDGVAAVLFIVAMLWVEHGNEAISTTAVMQILAFTTLGGLLTGAMCGILAVVVAGRSSDHLIETALTAVVAYGSFMLAEQLHASGVLATVAAGLVMGNIGALGTNHRHPSPLSEKGRYFILEFWEFVAFLANSLIFLLIGLRVATLSFSVLGSTELAVIILIVIVSRAAAVYPLCLPFMRSRWTVPIRHQHILWWGGLRGALGLALAMSLPETLVMHDQILIATFGTVAFSVVMQGLTMPGLMRLLKCHNDK